MAFELHKLFWRRFCFRFASPFKTFLFPLSLCTSNSPDPYCTCIGCIPNSSSKEESRHFLIYHYITATNCRGPDISEDQQRAKTLYEASYRQLIDNGVYCDLVKDIPLYLRLTKRDLKILFDPNTENPQDELSNGHLSDE